MNYLFNESVHLTKSYEKQEQNLAIKTIET